MAIIFLYGPPASGKTTLGRLWSQRMGVPFVDLDEQIVAREGKSIPALFKAGGEKLFRACEREALAATLAACKTEKSCPLVALGGGTLLSEENRRWCEAQGTILCLESPSEAELERRIKASEVARHLGNRARERAAHYASFPVRIASFASVGESLVVVGEGFAPTFLTGQKLVVDATVRELYPALAPSPVAILPSGEKYKTPATILSLWQAFAAAGMGRREVVTAVGGGVTGDLTGFAAATWMRGIAWVNVPTTLLAMVDASTGGKTGCDLPEGKNLAGAFHAPQLVLVDVAFLKTLPPAILTAGRAEMIKHEVIGGLARGDFSALPSASEVAENLAVKMALVREDPEERTGKRLKLNCGHTVGHALEKVTNYALSHGEAVAIGCVEEARLAVRLGLAPASWPAELAARFEAAGLGTQLPEGWNFEALVPFMRGDKKRQGESVVFALPCGWGEVRGVPVDLSVSAGGLR